MRGSGRISNVRALAFATLALVSGCAPVPPDAKPNAAPTIVSLNPCADAILAEVAHPAQILALSHYSHDPRATSMDLATARQFAVTGGTVEEVLALDPDVVVASTFLSASARQAFIDLGIRVDQVGTVSTIDESTVQIRWLAELAGNPGGGDRLIRSIDIALAEHAASPDAEPIPAVLWQPAGIVPGEGALVSELMRRTGFSSHSAVRGYGQADYIALEDMLIDPPQVLFVAGTERGQYHPALRNIAGMTQVRFDPSLLYCGGPTIIRALKRLRTVRDGIERA